MNHETFEDTCLLQYYHRKMNTKSENVLIKRATSGAILNTFSVNISIQDIAIVS